MTNESLARLRREAKQIAGSPLGFESRLTSDLHVLLVEAIRKRRISQRELAKLAGKRESFVSRVLSGGSNCTFRVVAELCHAAGVRPRLVSQEQVNRIFKTTGHVTTKTHASTTSTKKLTYEPRAESASGNYIVKFTTNPVLLDRRGDNKPPQRSADRFGQTISPSPRYRHRIGSN